ncbi:hypothetical protein [Desulfobacula toluolica]|uniref:Uncharacterized protein n=1 Tax=Desulfobacula toluolica (strain DSM 7467 / Tol2) TaxID=651182 RepID=K0NP13_DESTT|nr:hypothetical protein [Desulfobacula toluolica]CCK82415.1 uncharacterized protein TOL2_C42590 [Desulfobacula toluolica Tol2]
MFFLNALEHKLDSKGVITLRSLKDGVETNTNYAQIAAGLHWPEKGSPGFCVILGELLSREKGLARKPIRGQLQILAESEYQIALPAMFSKIGDEIGLFGCTDIYCDDRSTGRREFAEAFWDFRHKNESLRGRLQFAPFADNFPVGFHEVQHQITTGRLKIPAGSICYEQLQKIRFDDLGDSEVHLRFYALDALRFAAGAMVNRTPKPYQKKSKRRRLSGMVI